MSAFDRVLVIETSARLGQVALAANDAVVAEARLGEGRRRASDLALVVNRMLKERAWRARELTAVVVGLGPGSYTGLRVGLASAKSLAYATGCAFFGVETFAAIAERLPVQARAASVIADALQGKLFRRDYRRSAADEWEPLTRLEIISAADWLGALQSGDWVSGAATGAFEGALAKDVQVAKADEREPRAIDLLNVAQRYPWAVTTDMWTAEPFYLRGSSAEERAGLSGREPGTAGADR